jgi:hypothetical protein
MMIEKERDFFIILLVDVINRRQTVKGQGLHQIIFLFKVHKQQQKRGHRERECFETVEVVDCRHDGQSIPFIRTKCNEIL